jgi:hypothetical protein
MMWKPAVLKVMLIAGACLAAGAVSVASRSPGGHGSHGGGHSHGSFRGGHTHGGFHLGRSGGGGGGHFGSSNRHGGFSGGFSGAPRQRSSISNTRSGAFSSQQYRSSAYDRAGFASSSNRVSNGRGGLGHAGAPRSTSGGNAGSVSSLVNNRPPGNRFGYGNQEARRAFASREVPSGASRPGSIYRSSFDSNRPPSAQPNSAPESLRGGSALARGTAASRTLSWDSNRHGDRAGSANYAPQVRNPLGGGSLPNSPSSAHKRGFSSDSNRPSNTRSGVGSGLGNWSGRGNSSWRNTSYFGSGREGSNFGNAHFNGSRFRNSSFSRWGHGGFAGGRPFSQAPTGFGGGGGFDGGPGWLFGDLFGLALDLGRFSWPYLGFVGLNLLDSALQSSSWNSNTGYPPGGAPCPDLYSPGDFACTQ